MPLPLNVLMVDHPSAASHALRAAFAEAGIPLLWATTPAEALVLLPQHRVALALLPAELAALAAQIRNAPGQGDTPVIFFAGSANEAAALYAADHAGAVDVLLQPVAPAVLLGKSRWLLDLQRQQRQLSERGAELERLSRLNAVMIGALVHDIRTPLAALTLNAELVIRRAEGQAVRQAGARIKGATAMLSRQAEHLVKLADAPLGDLRAELARTDLAALVQARIAAAAGQALLGTEVTFHAEGATEADVDAALIAQAVDQLLLLAAMHGDGQAVSVRVDGSARRTLLLRVAMGTVLAESARQHLFGGTEAAAGSGLDLAERIARAHGGSLIGRSKEHEGTLFELLLPRGLG